jgi:hypothetical protein
MQFITYALPFICFPLALALAAALEWLATGKVGLAQLPGALRHAFTEREGLLALASITLASWALALLPWPFNPTGASNNWLWAAAMLELAFLLPIVAALFSGAPLVARAAIRELQIGSVGRAGLWVALAAGLSLGAASDLWAIVARLLIVGVGLLALPPAIGWGPFGAESSLVLDGPEQGLNPPTAYLARLARLVSSAVLSVALLIALLPLALAMPIIGLLMIAAGLLVIGILLRQIAGRWPRMILRDALNFCLLRVLPLSLAVLVCLVLSSMQ